MIGGYRTGTFSASVANYSVTVGAKVVGQVAQGFSNNKGSDSSIANVATSTGGGAGGGNQIGTRYDAGDGGSGGGGGYQFTSGGNGISGQGSAGERISDQSKALRFRYELVTWFWWCSRLCWWYGPNSLTMEKMKLVKMELVDKQAMDDGSNTKGMQTIMVLLEVLAVLVVVLVIILL